MAEKNETRRKDDHWSVEKSINIPNIVGALTIAGSVVMWLMHEDARLTTIEVRQVDAEKSYAQALGDVRDNISELKSRVEDLVNKK